MADPVEPWWKEAVAYQIYPASWADGNGDGVGDFEGMTARLPYLQQLGVNLLWVSPFFAGPNQDQGYDISDYTAVHEPYGTLEDVEVFIKKAHELNMKVIFDLVVNHTSDQHAWFKESRSSKDNPKRDWYIWKPAKKGPNGGRLPPNNWAGYFGGSAWEWDEQTEEYYLHLFVPEQPDLNFEIAECRQAIYRDACLFWLDRGCDGFRLDTVALYSKRLDFPDAPVKDPSQPHQFAPDLYRHGPRIHEFLGEMAQSTWLRYPGSVTVGECGGCRDLSHMLQYVGAKEKQLDMIFDFGHFYMLKKSLTEEKKWTLPQMKNIIATHQELTTPENDGWCTVFLENHDSGRSINRYANASPEHRTASAKMLAVYMMTLTGTPFLYQGQELGMVNVPASWPIDEYKDVWSQMSFAEYAKKWKGDQEMLDKGMLNLQKHARDHARTPFHWDGTDGAGFSPPGAEAPWMRVQDSSKEINAADQLNDPQSTLSFYKHLIALRKERADLFAHGGYEVVDVDNPATWTFTKTSLDNRQRALVSLNFSDKEHAISLPDGVDLTQATLLVSSAGLESGQGKLKPYEGRVHLI